MCSTLKKLTNKLQPYFNVSLLIIEILVSKKGNDTRVLEHLLSFADHQFGKEVTGKHYRERGVGGRISNFEVDIEISNNIIKMLVNLYLQNDSLCNLDRDDMILPYLKRSLSLLNPWVTNLHLDVREGNSILSEEQENTLLKELYFAEQGMAAIAMNRRQIDLAEGLCQRCLAYTRRYGLEGEKKTTMIFTALQYCCNLRQLQGNLLDALTFSEECHNLVVEAYDPVHSQVQEAAGILIHILIAKGDLFDAERYAQVTYCNLRDKKNGMDQESEAIAEGAYNLSDVIFQQNGDLIKAEELARESLRIRSLINDSNNQSVGRNCNHLAAIMRAQEKYGDETKGLYERFLAISIRNTGPDGQSTAIGNCSLGIFHYQLALK
jgi:hypothetical protein